MGISPGHEYETKRHAPRKQAGRLSNIRGRIAGVRSTERSEELFSSGDADADHASLLAMGCGHFAGPQRNAGPQRYLNIAAKNTLICIQTVTNS
jgi:hypothetical protein